MSVKVPKVSYKPCPVCSIQRTHANSDMCRKCRWKARGKKSKEDHRDQSVSCPTCGGRMAHTSSQCQQCSTGAARSWEQVMAEYNARNPDDQLSFNQVKSIAYAAMAKIKRLHSEEFRAQGLIR